MAGILVEPATAGRWGHTSVERGATRMGILGGLALLVRVEADDQGAPNGDRSLPPYRSRRHSRPLHAPRARLPGTADPLRPPRSRSALDDRADGRRRHRDRDDERPRLVAPALLPAGHVRRRLRLDVQRHPHGRGLAPRGIRTPPPRRAAGRGRAADHASRPDRGGRRRRPPRHPGSDPPLGELRRARHRGRGPRRLSRLAHVQRARHPAPRRTRTARDAGRRGGPRRRRGIHAPHDHHSVDVRVHRVPRDGILGHRVPPDRRNGATHRRRGRTRESPRRRRHSSGAEAAHGSTLAP